MFLSAYRTCNQLPALCFINDLSRGRWSLDVIAKTNPWQQKLQYFLLQIKYDKIPQTPILFLYYCRREWIQTTTNQSNIYGEMLKPKRLLSAELVMISLEWFVYEFDCKALRMAFLNVVVQNSNKCGAFTEDHIIHDYRHCPFASVATKVCYASTSEAIEAESILLVLLKFWYYNIYYPWVDMTLEMCLIILVQMNWLGKISAMPSHMES